LASPSSPSARFKDSELFNTETLKQPALNSNE
jgi:hypothetical protein